MATLRGLNCCAVFFQNLHNECNLLGMFDKTDFFRNVHPDGKPCIGFYIMIILSGLFSKVDTATDLYFQRGYTYDVLIRLNHVFSGNGIDIAKFSFSTNNIEKKYMSKRFLIKVHEELPCGAGEYSVRVFIKEHEDTTWFLQNEQHFIVINDL